MVGSKLHSLEFQWDRIINRIELGSHIYTDTRIKTQTQSIVEGRMYMCICTNMYTHVCEGVYIYERDYVWIHIYVGPHIYTDIRIRIHIYRHKDQETQNSIEGNMCMCIYANKYTHACERI